MNAIDVPLSGENIRQQDLRSFLEERMSSVFKGDSLGRFYKTKVSGTLFLAHGEEQLALLMILAPSCSCVSSIVVNMITK